MQGDIYLMVTHRTIGRVCQIVFVESIISSPTQETAQTFPLIIPFFTINMVLCMKNFLMVFDQIMALTKGGPAQSTESISFLIYNNGMSGGQFGFQSANAVIFFIVIVTISVFQMRFLNSKEEQL